MANSIETPGVFEYQSDFVPGTLYIMISIPHPYQIGTMDHDYPDCPPQDISFATYDAAAASGHVPEEFLWDLYYHRGASGGRLYRLRKMQSHPRPVYEYDHVNIPDARRLGQCIGFVAVVTAPSLADVELYVDEVARGSAPEAARTFVWAVTAAFRVRKHVEEEEGSYTCPSFGLGAFTEELLRFAYYHVHYVLAGGCEKSIVGSSDGARRKWVDGETMLGQAQWKKAFMYA